MVTFILERHGQSEGNQLSIFTGHKDVCLTELGKKQGECAAQYITETYKIDRIYSSDLSRAVQTAQYVADKTGLEITKSEKLRELYAGEWDGTSFETILSDYADDWKIWCDDVGNSRCTGGESVKELGERFIGALEAIAKENDGKTVLIATHATPIRVTQCLLGGKTLDDMKNIPWGANASITVVEYDNGKWTLKLASFSDYLGELTTNLPTNV